jgi:hypothetical protein
MWMMEIIASTILGMASSVRFVTRVPQSLDKDHSLSPGLSDGTDAQRRSSADIRGTNINSI